MQKCKTECENSRLLSDSDATCFACAKLERSCRGNHVLEAPLGFVTARRTDRQTDRQRTCPGRAGRRRAGRRPGPGGPRPSPGAGRGLEQKVSRSRGINSPLHSQGGRMSERSPSEIDSESAKFRVRAGSDSVRVSQNSEHGIQSLIIQSQSRL
jgi:hypothetical protein